MIRKNDKFVENLNMRERIIIAKKHVYLI